MKTNFTPSSVVIVTIFSLISSFSIAQHSNWTVTDIDGNVYHTIIIGEQVWMVENLRTTRYQNGDSITMITDSTFWGRVIQGAYCNYNHDESNSIIYGRLYNYFVVADNRGACPEGWEVPEYSMWKKLVNNVGGNRLGNYLDALPKLKANQENSWTLPGNNESGFTGLPAGVRWITGTFGLIGTKGYFWSSTEKKVKYIGNSKKTSVINVFKLCDDYQDVLAQAKEGGMPYGKPVYINGKPTYNVVWETEFSSKNIGISIRCIKIDY